MPHKTTSRLRELLEELRKAQHESGGLLRQARREVAEVIAGDGLRPIGTAGTSPRKTKARRRQKKR